MVTMLMAFQTYAANMKYTVAYGEKISVFEINKTKTGAVLNFENNYGKKTVRELSQDDYKYLLKTAQNYKGANQKQFCQRSFILFESKKKTHLGCLGSTTPIARSLQKTTNLLSLLL